MLLIHNKYFRVSKPNERVERRLGAGSTEAGLRRYGCVPSRGVSIGRRF